MAFGRGAFIFTKHRGKHLRLLTNVLSKEIWLEWPHRAPAGTFHGVRCRAALTAYRLHGFSLLVLGGRGRGRLAHRSALSRTVWGFAVYCYRYTLSFDILSSSISYTNNTISCYMLSYAVSYTNTISFYMLSLYQSRARESSTLCPALPKCPKP